MYPLSGSDDQLKDLSWDKGHRRNTQNKYCYCGKPRTKCQLNSRELTLDIRWCWNVVRVVNGFTWNVSRANHLRCLWLAIGLINSHVLSVTLPEQKLVLCQPQRIGRKALTADSNRTDIVRVALWNLVLRERQKGSDRRFFQYKDELCTLIDKNWNSLCMGKTRTTFRSSHSTGTKTWENTIGSSLSTKQKFFESGVDSKGPGFWGLRSETDPSLDREGREAPRVIKKKKLPKKKRSAYDAFPDDKGAKVRKPKAMPQLVYFPRAVYSLSSFIHSPFIRSFFIPLWCFFHSSSFLMSLESNKRCGTL